MEIKRLPKFELHCHLDGSVPVETIQELAGDKTISQDELMVEDSCQSLAKYLTKFEIPLRYMQSEYGLEQAAFGLMKAAAKENVKYIEVRFAPMLSVQEGLATRTVIESVFKGLQKGQEAYKIQFNMIVCAMRHHGLERNLTMLKTAREMIGEGVCALDLAGDEAAVATREYYDLFLQAQKWDMPFTIHSGECGSILNVKTAYELGAKRIGHGIALQKDRDLLLKFAEAKIGIEMCPTSNLQTKAVTKWEDYPVFRYLEHGLKASINTDNRTVSNTSMTRELEMVYESSKKFAPNKSGDEIIKQLLCNAVETSFAEDNQKHQWLKDIEAEF